MYIVGVGEELYELVPIGLVLRNVVLESNDQCAVLALRMAVGIWVVGGIRHVIDA